ncbi:Type II inositol 1,4,5-trisphosphate 5-phosphatase, partial [Coemansia thaxteri]
FGEVMFDQLVCRSMRLTNSGQVPLEFSFVATLSRPHYAPPWLKIVPDSGMLLPGEMLDLKLSVLVDERTSALLSTRAEDLCDILVLHLNRGRDYFIQVQGKYQPSVFGTSLDVLVHCKTAVRTMSRNDFEQCLSSGQFSVPKCVWSMTDFLMCHAVDRGYSLFYWPGDHSLALRVRECLDLDQPLDPSAILQWSVCSEDHAAHTVVDDPIELVMRQHRSSRVSRAGHAFDLLQPDELADPRMSLTAQTLVSSTMHSAFSAFDMPNVPSTAEALEQLSLSSWSVHGLNNRNQHAHQGLEAASVAANANCTPPAVIDRDDDEGQDGAGPDYAPTTGTSSDAGSSHGEDAITSNHSTLLSAAYAYQDSHSGDQAATSTLPETIVSAALAAPHDTGTDTVAGCLVSFFASLPEPLVPAELYDACVEAGGMSRAAALEALEVLPPGNLNVLVYLLAFLREAIERGATTPQRVGQVFAGALLRPPPERVPCESDYERLCLFIVHLL